MTGTRRALGALLALAVLLLGGLLTAPPAAALPGIPDCKSAPTPEVPGRGVVGFFESEPKTLPPAGDPFAPNATTTIYQQYGYAGLRFNNYDLGCANLLTAPAASAGTSVANWLMTFPKAAVAATGAVLNAAFAPSFLQLFDPLVDSVVQTLRHEVFDQWVTLVLAAVGLLLIWRARQASLASSAAAIGWALLVMVIATMVFRWPLVAGHAADQTVTQTLGAVTGGLNGTSSSAQGGPADKSIAEMHEALLYQTWLGGTFGDANSDVAHRYGPVIFDSQALTWAQAKVLKDDPARGQQIIQAKEKTFEETAAKIKDEDPDAYAYLTGDRSDTRVGYALLAGIATLCAVPFLLVASLLVLGALIIVRFGVMLFPAFATLGLFPAMRSLVTGIGNTLAAALINAIVFGIGAAVTVRGIGVLLAPSTALPPWLDVVLLLLLTVVMWVALRPFRRLTMMVSRNRNHFGAAAGGVSTVTRGVARTTGRVITTALATFLGVSAASRHPAQEPALAGTAADGVPQRAEAVSSYDSEPAAPAAAREPATLHAPVPVGAEVPTATSGLGPSSRTAGSSAAAAPPSVPTGRSEGGVPVGSAAAAAARVENNSFSWIGDPNPDVGSRNGYQAGGRFESGGPGRRPEPVRAGNPPNGYVIDPEFDDLSDVFRPESAGRDSERVLEGRGSG